jgi:FkbM family methyltransferase
VYRWTFILGKFVPIEHLKNVRTIVDCGAYTGITSLYFLNKFPLARVIAVEPDRDNYEICKANLKPYKTRAELVNAAIWFSRGVVQVVRGNDRYRNAWKIQVTGQHGSGDKVPALDMKTLMKDHHITKIDILKINIEGSELNLFQEQVDWLESVDSITIELHSRECGKTFLDAVKPYKFLPFFNDGEQGMPYYRWWGGIDFGQTFMRKAEKA